MFLAERFLSLLLVDQRLTVRFAASAADQQPAITNMMSPWWRAKNSRLS
jgi:hypothetical protein